MAGNNLSQACVHLQGSPKGDAEGQEHLEDSAKVLFFLYQVLRLGISAAGRIVKNFPEEEINVLSSCCCVYLPIGIVQGWILLGIECQNVIVPICRVQGVKHLAVRHLGIIFWGPSFVQVIESGLVNIQFEISNMFSCPYYVICIYY